MRKAFALLAVAGLVSLAACNKGKDEDDGTVPIDNEVTNGLNAGEEQPLETPPVLEPETPASNNSAAPAPPPPPPVTQDQQTLDDADATGLTSRLPDDYVPSSDQPSAAQ